VAFGCSAMGAAVYELRPNLRDPTGEGDDDMRRRRRRRMMMMMMMMRMMRMRMMMMRMMRMMRMMMITKTTTMVHRTKFVLPTMTNTPAHLPTMRVTGTDPCHPSPVSSGVWALPRLWARDDVSCGTSIPVVSTHPESRAAYCIGQSRPSARHPITYSVTPGQSVTQARHFCVICAGLSRNSTQWSLLGLDMLTGADRLAWPFYDRNLANNFFANPFYAAAVR
jgi:hypothetical protein